MDQILLLRETLKNNIVQTQYIEGEGFHVRYSYTSRYRKR